MPRKVKMNNIQNDRIANYSVGFQGRKILKGAEKDLRRTIFFRQGETKEEWLNRIRTEAEEKVVKKYKATPKDVIPYNCSDGSEDLSFLKKLDMQIRNLEKYIEEHPNDIEAKAQLSKLKDVIKM